MSNVSLPEDVITRLDCIKDELEKRTGVPVSYGYVVTRLLEYYPASK
ncbi:MAG: hypothetical protein WC556_07970 [Candidatus Methanoperedens sp.]